MKKLIWLYRKGISACERTLTLVTHGDKKILFDWIYDGYHRLVEKSIEKELRDTILRFRNDRKNDDTLTIKRSRSQIVWVMWWQRDEIPFLVAQNLKRMKRLIHWKVIVLDKENVFEYISASDEIRTQLNHDKIPLAAFADYVRTKILFKYGGIWLDSTIFVADEDNEINNGLFDNLDFVSFKGIRDFGHKFIATDRWAVYCLGGSKCQPVFDFVNQGLDHYLTAGIPFPDYFLMDYLFDIAYRFDIGDFKRKNNELYCNNIGAERLALRMNSDFNVNDYKRLKQTFMTINV